MLKSLPLILLFLLSTAASFAASLEDMRNARDRILERLPEIENLWNRGLTVETNEGFVSARSSLNRTQIQLIQQENRDRSTLYSYIARKTGTDLFQVSRERALQIAEMAKNGLWIQADNGDWKRK